MAEVVTLTPPKGDPEIVESMRVLLSEAQNGRLRSFVCLYVTNEGEMTDAYNYTQGVDRVALESFLKAPPEE